MNALRRYVPATGWISSYRLGWLRFDLVAGLTLWGILVPEAIAYAGMAGAPLIPVQAGLYALVFSLPLFAFFGTSRQLAVALSLVLLIWKTSRPAGTALGRVPGRPGAYSSIERHPGNQPVAGLIIYRFDVPLFFANASQQRDRLSELMKGDPPPRALLVDLQVSPGLDLSSLDMLAELADEAAARGVTLMFCEVIEPVRQSLDRAGVLEKLGEDRVFQTVDEGVQAFLFSQGDPEAGGQV